MDTIAVEQLKYIHNTLERMSVRQEETNRLLSRIIELHEWAEKQVIECPNGEARELISPDLNEANLKGIVRTLEEWTAANDNRD